MKNRPAGFLSEDNIDHNGEIFNYIKELHEYLWLFVWAVDPGSGGYLNDHVDAALKELQKRNQPNPVSGQIVESPHRPRSCNRHSNCDEADAAVRARNGFGASHCHDDECEDCFGC